MLAVVLTGLAGLLAGPALAQWATETTRTGSHQCWSDRDLAARPGEDKIRKGLRTAYQPVPPGEVSPLPAGHRRTGKVIRRVDLPKGLKLVAFTFDLCEQPHEIAGYQGGIVDFLRQNHVPATFFAGGKWMVSHPERAQQILGDPLFEIGNHAWEHRNFQLLTPDRMHTEIAAAQLAYKATYEGLAARRCLDRAGNPAERNSPPQTGLFRFPFGACTPAAIEAVESYGLAAIQWDVSSSDPWTGQSADGIVRDVMKRVSPGSIVLFHANGRGYKTGGALPALVDRLRKDGYRFVKVSELLRAGTPVYSPLCYDYRPGDVDRYQSLSRRLEATYDRFYSKIGKRRPVLSQRPPLQPSLGDRSKLDFVPPAMGAALTRENRSSEPMPVQPPAPVPAVPARSDIDAAAPPPPGAGESRPQPRPKRSLASEVFGGSD